MNTEEILLRQVLRRVEQLEREVAELKEALASPPAAPAVSGETDEVPAS